MANKRRKWLGARLHAREAIHPVATLGDPPQLRHVESVKPSDGIFGGAGALQAWEGWATAECGASPGVGAGLEAVEKDDLGGFP